jgi:hypothetical protein
VIKLTKLSAYSVYILATNTQILQLGNFREKNTLELGCAEVENKSFDLLAASVPIQLIVGKYEGLTFRYIPQQDVVRHRVFSTNLRARCDTSVAPTTSKHLINAENCVGISSGLGDKRRNLH